MRRLMMGALLGVMMFSVGCNRKRDLSAIPIRPDLTMDEYEDLLGSPTQRGNDHHWIGYALKGGDELRLYFLNGTPGGRRTLSQAYIFGKQGYAIRHIYDVPPTTQPARAPEPATQTVPAANP